MTSPSQLKRKPAGFVTSCDVPKVATVTPATVKDVPGMNSQKGSSARYLRIPGVPTLA